MYVADLKIVSEHTNLGAASAIKLNSKYAALATTDGRIVLQRVILKLYNFKAPSLSD